MAAKISPVGNWQFLLGSGLPAVGGQLFTYVAGSVSTKQNSYTDDSGGVANSNPIVLNSLGMSTNGIWLLDGLSYKIVYAPVGDTDPPSSPIKTWDDVIGVTGTAAAADEWIASGLTPTFVTAQSFTLAGDQTAAFSIGRRLKTTNSGGTVYGTITGSVFGVVTTVTTINEGGQSFDAGMSAVSYGMLSLGAVLYIPTAYSMPKGVFADNEGWVLLGKGATFVNTTSFTLAGDFSGFLLPGRKLQLVYSLLGSTYGWVVTSVFGAGTTTVTVQNEFGAVIDATLVAVMYSAISPGFAFGSQALPSGYTFPATQIPITDVNTIDDYEEGVTASSWTPVLTFATAGNLSVVYSAQYGGYIKVGKLVTVWFHITTSTFTHTTASGNLQITGLPFAAQTIAGIVANFVGNVRWSGITKATYTAVVPVIEDAASLIEFSASGSGVAVSAVAFGDMPTGGTVSLRGSITYPANA